MSRRDVIAVVLGVILGLIFSVLTYFSGMGAGAVLLLAIVLAPLITSLVAAKRLFIAALVPNILIAIVCSIAFIFLGPRKQAMEEALLSVLGFVVFACAPAIAIAGVVWFVRRKIKSRTAGGESSKVSVGQS